MKTGRPARSNRGPSGRDPGRAAGIPDWQPVRQTPGELRRVFDDLRAVEPLLRKAADDEIRTTMPLGDVVTAVLRLIGA